MSSKKKFSALYGLLFMVVTVSLGAYGVAVSLGVAGTGLNFREPEIQLTSAHLSGDERLPTVEAGQRVHVQDAGVDSRNTIICRVGSSGKYGEHPRLGTLTPILPVSESVVRKPKLFLLVSPDDEENLLPDTPSTSFHGYVTTNSYGRDAAAEAWSVRSGDFILIRPLRPGESSSVQTNFFMSSGVGLACSILFIVVGLVPVLYWIAGSKKRNPDVAKKNTIRIALRLNPKVTCRSCGTQMKVSRRRLSSLSACPKCNTSPFVFEV
ncbi:MAG: hypothetical protein KDB32_06400 [Planctomycetes bacterium]|nr:hypothetical protein [Planctomycetota bacterium]MCA8945403.1 hypothetical protein [Planctomycetota bacterium]